MKEFLMINEQIVNGKIAFITKKIGQLSWFGARVLLYIDGSIFTI